MSFGRGNRFLNELAADDEGRVGSVSVVLAKSFSNAPYEVKCAMVGFGNSNSSFFMRLGGSGKTC